MSQTSNVSSSTTFAYAGFVERAFALFLDSLILLIPYAAVHAVVPVIGPVLVWFCYKAVFEASPAQATPGKRVLGIYVTDLEGNRITLKASSIRFFVFTVSAVCLFVGHLLALFTSRKQALHDMVADTLVLKGVKG